MEELKPCPFCGGKAHKWSWNGGVCIECENYHVDKHRISFQFQTEEEASEAWNRRVNDG